MFGLARREHLTFHQCITMHLLREELDFQVSPELVREAAAWFDVPAPADPLHNWPTRGSRISYETWTQSKRWWR